MARILPPKYVFASVLISLGGLGNGYDTGSIGAMVAMSQFKKSIGALPPTLVGFTVALVMLTGVVPSVFTGHLADRFGRLRIILAGATLFGLGSLLEGTANSLAQFLVGRALAGLGEGVYLGNMAVYICEIAPVQFRGTLAGLPQFMATAGVCIGYFTCYGSSGIPSSLAWRTPCIIQCLIASILVLGCLCLPESPRWLMTHGKRVEALRALQRLDFPMTEAERDFLTATEQRPSLPPWQTFLLLFRKNYRSRTILGFVVLGMIQLSGIDGVLYYAPTLFAQAGLSSETASFLASGVSALLMVVISIPAFLFVDKWGRRTSAITGGILLSGCMLLIGSLYAAGAVHSYGVARWVVITAVFIFGITYSATWGIVGKIYASEIQPSHTRATSNSVATGLGFFTNWLVAILTPIILDKSAFGVYFLFGGLSLGTVIFLAAYMPETRGMTLEDIQRAFNQPKVKNVTHYVRSLFRILRNGRPTTRADDRPVELDTLNVPESIPTRGLRLDVTVP